MAAPIAAAFVEKSLQQFRYGTKQITGKSGKTYTVPIIRISAGTSLFSATPHESGFKDETAAYVDSQSGMWLSWLEGTARVYSKHGPAWRDRWRFELRTFKAKRDLDLLDLWTSDGWTAVLQEADANGLFPEPAALSGLTTTSEDFVQQSLETTMFPGAKCIDPPPPATPCKTMEWNGLPWGSERGQFKRSSDAYVDTPSLATIYACFGPDAFDGIFDRPLPSPSGQYTLYEQPHKVFHEEMNLRPPFSEKLLVLNPDGTPQDPQPDPSTFGAGEMGGQPPIRWGDRSIPPAPPASDPPAPFKPSQGPVTPTPVPLETWKALSDKVPPPRPSGPAPWTLNYGAEDPLEDWNAPPSSSSSSSGEPAGLASWHVPPSSSSSGKEPGLSNGGRKKQRTRRSKKPTRRRQTRKQ